jgi:hypothetical protein
VTGKERLIAERAEFFQNEIGERGAREWPQHLVGAPLALHSAERENPYSTIVFRQSDIHARR